MSAESCLNLLVEVEPRTDRVGPLVVTGLLNDASQSKTWKVPRSLNYQVYFLLTCFGRDINSRIVIAWKHCNENITNGC